MYLIMEQPNMHNMGRFASPYTQKSLERLNLGSYWFWAALRVILTLIPQTGYIHPDEYFQTVEVIAGDVFKTDISPPWEFNKTFPVRSISVIYSTIYVPFYILRVASELIETYTGMQIISPYLVLVTPRLMMCLISFLSDYCLFKICYLFGQNYKERLIIYGSSYVTLVFMTRTFTNSIEVTLFNVMLYLVASCIADSEKALYQQNYLKTKYYEAETIADRVKINKLIKLLPKHSLKRCFPIALITVAGFFNRPTFALYSIGPLFFWFERGLSTVSFLKDFHIRISIFLLYSFPMICFFIFIDSVYYGYITMGEILTGQLSLNNFVVTPLNFARYNLNSTNLSSHGVHPRFLHTLVNIPLLFNVLGIAGLLVLVKLAIRGGMSHWTLLPKCQSITGMMTMSFTVPLMLLSMFVHQEPRFLIPLLIPFVFLYSHLINDFEEDCQTVEPYRKRFPKERKAQGFMKYPMKCLNYVERITESVDNRHNISGRYLSSMKVQEITKKEKMKDKASPNKTRINTTHKPNHLMRIWHVLNIICLLFFGFVHQGGVYPLTKNFHNELLKKPRYTTYHLVTSHAYPIPVHLLMLKSNHKIKNADFQLHELGSENFENIHSKLVSVLNMAEEKKTNRRRNYKVFYALPTSLFNEFSFSHRYYSENYNYAIVDVYYPHFSSEALPNFLLNVTSSGDLDIFKNSEIINMIDVLPLRYAIDFFHQFGLILLKISLRKTE